MTIMFAGGMTIAIPGELPTAVAQTNTLSVSAAAAGVFGGAQVIEIVIDDPDLNEIGTGNTAVPDVEVDGNAIAMTQASTGKWYAYVAAMAFVDSELTTGPYTASPAADPVVDNDHVPTEGFLDGSPIPRSDLRVLVFPFDGDFEITANRGDEVVTLNYDDHSDIATISVDRNDVPVGGQVHITISDFQLNLDPTADDAWILNATGSATYNNVLDATDDQGGDQVPVPSSIDLTGTSGELATSGQDMSAIEYSGNTNIVRIDETGSNTGVFESSDGDDLSEISVNEEASDGETFTIEYADNSQQIIVNEFSPILALITDGAWSAGQTITVRLSSEDLNLNTLVDDDMTPGSDDLPVMTFGTPTTPSSDTVAMAEEKIGDSMTFNEKTHVITLMTTSEMTNLTVTLTEQALLQNSNLRHYVNYLSDFKTTTNAQLVDNEDGTKSVDLNNGITRIDVADGIFNLTLAATPEMIDGADDFDADANAALHSVVAAAQAAVANDDDAATTKSNAQAQETGAPADAISAIVAIDTADEAFDTAEEVATEVERIAAMYVTTITATIVADIFTIDGVQNNAIYRALLEETSSDSGVFEGTIEYAMLNQKNVVQDETYEGATSVDDELAIILNGHPDADTPEVTYGGDHVTAKRTNTHR